MISTIRISLTVVTTYNASNVVMNKLNGSLIFINMACK